MPRRSELVTRGDARAANRALLRAVGLTNEDFEKPFIGVVNTWSEINPGHIHLRTLSEAAKQGIRAGGGVPCRHTVQLRSSTYTAVWPA